MQPPEGAAFHITGEFRDVEPARRLVFTFEYEEPDPDDRVSVLTLSFVDVASGTRLVSDHGPFATEARRALHETGWAETLDGLERFLAPRGNEDTERRDRDEVETETTAKGRPPLGALAALDQCDPVTDPRPGFVARQHEVRFELVRRCEHERIREPQASGLAPELCRRPRNRRGKYLESNREVREERLDLGHCFAPSAMGRDEDLRVCRRRDQQLVVLVLGERLHRRSVKRVVGIEKCDDDRRVEDD